MSKFGQHYTLYSNNNKTSDQLIVVGPFTGGYGHFFCQYLQYIRSLREEYADSTIVCSAATVFHHYALRFADYFYGFKHNWSHIKAAGSVSDDLTTNPDLLKYKQYVVADFNKEPDIYTDTLTSNINCHNIYISRDCNSTLLRERPYNPNSKLIIVWGRMKHGADWRNGNAQQWRQTIEHLQRNGYEVAIAGSRGTSMFFEDMGGIIDLTNYDDVERGAVINGALQDALCALVDMSGTMCECYLVGCPLLTYNADPRHIVVIPRRNIHGVKESFYVPKEWPHWQTNPMVDGDMSFMPKWLEAVDKFIEECKISKPWQHDVKLNTGVFTKL